MLLMFELVLWLLSLLSSLLLLNDRKCVLWLIHVYVLTQGLRTFILGGLGRGLMLVVDRVTP
jgi:hypothetical protein